MKKIYLADFPLHVGSRQEFFTKLFALAAERSSSYVCLANAHMVVEAHAEAGFRRVVDEADLVFADGMSLVYALRLIHGIRQERLAGMDILGALLAEASRRQLSVFFYGSTPEILNAVSVRTAHDNPSLKISGLYSPPFRPLSAEEESADAKRINDSEAHLVLVALGCPKQERWMARNRGHIQGVMVGLGGAFPVYAGATKRAPVWMQEFCLEWFFRFLQEPKRLWKRYLVTNSKFLLLAGKEWLKKK
jgi:N-acetylglucosaminyldiphosphoundecaprenol N-acetyl-beta-D-mannosaminyltransferase